MIPQPPPPPSEPKETPPLSDTEAKLLALGILALATLGACELLGFLAQLHIHLVIGP